MERFLKKCLRPPRPDYAAAGDILRVLSVYMVGWYHIWQQSWLNPSLRIGNFNLNLTAPVRAGYMFVDLMLLLSGFLLYLPYANRRECSPKEFYLKRALRILPCYWLCLLLMLAYAWFQSGFPGDRTLGLDLLTHLTFTHNFFEFSYTQTRMNVVLWTLAVEVQFYLFLPALAPAFRKKPLTCYLAMTAVSLCFRYLWTMPMQDTTLFVNRLPNMLDVYANGMLAAHLYVRLAKDHKRRPLIAALGLAACVAGFVGLCHILKVQARVSGYDNVRLGQLRWRYLFSLCGAAFLLGGSLSFTPLRALFSNRLVRFLSAVSFNFYIWHQWLAVRLKAWRIPPYLAEANPNQVGEMPWQMQYTAVCFLGALAVAILLTYLVEKPCARLARKWIDRWCAAPPVRFFKGKNDNLG